MAINLQSGGTVREWLLNETGQIRAAGTVREFLLSSPTSLIQSAVVRETLLVSPVVSATELETALAVREALLPSTGALQSAIVRETLFFHPPTQAWPSKVVREAMSYNTGVMHISRILREALIQSGPMHVSLAIREALIITQNVLTISKTVREILFEPLTFMRASTVARESLNFVPTAPIPLFSFVSREALYQFSGTVLARLSALVREAVVANTLGLMSFAARETLIIGIDNLLVKLLVRETFLVDPVPPPPLKSRKAYWWINYGVT